MKNIRFSGLAVLVLLSSLGVDAVGGEEVKAEVEWVAAMKKVHEGFSGNKGYVAQLGDSITYSMAFWAALQWKDPSPFIKEDGLPKAPEGKKWGSLIKGFRDKGGKNGNYSGWRIGNLLKVVDQVLASKKPEAAIIMIGTNDVRGNKVPAGYEKGVETVLTKCMQAKCVPILSTIPPMRGKKEGVDAANVIIKALAAKHKVPLVDFHAEVMKRQPTGWDGTLISKDGVHPSGGKFKGFDEETLKKNGYALRNFTTFLAFREVYFRVLSAK